MPNEDELNLKSMLSDFSRKSKGSYKFSVIIENNLELLESINKREGLSWSEIHRISEIPQSFLTFQGTIYRARKKRGSEKLKPEHQKKDTIKSLKTIPKSINTSKEIKPENNDSLKYPSALWAEKTLLNDHQNNIKFFFKRLEALGFEPSDFENLDDYKISTISSIINGWRTIKTNKLIQNPPSKEEFLRPYKRKHIK